jgi:hypothetical protein
VKSLYGVSGARGLVSLYVKLGSGRNASVRYYLPHVLDHLEKCKRVPSVGQHLKGRSVLRKRGKYWHYQFEHNGVPYWGYTRETVKSNAEMFEALKPTEVVRQTGNLMFRKAPLLKEFAKRFLEHIQKQKLAGSLDADTAGCYRNGWRLLESTDMAHMRMDQIGAAETAELAFPGGTSNAN